MANLSDIMAGGGSVLTDSRITNAVLTGFSASVGALTSTDTVIQGFNKLEGNTRRFRTQLSPGAAELTGGTTEPLLMGYSSATAAYTHWSELQYNDTTAQEAIWCVSSVLTKDWSGGNITVRIRWNAVNHDATKNVVWQVRMVGRTTDETIDVAFDTANTRTVTTAVNDTTLCLKTSEITFTPTAAELTAGDTWWIAIGRVAADGSDTHVGDAKLIDAGVFEV